MQSVTNLLVVALGMLPTAVSTNDLLPVVAASIHDEPRDGLGDLFNDPPFTGLLREQSTREDRAILEYDVLAFAGEMIGADIAGTVFVNNALDTGVRSFNALLYAGNGVADLSDFEIAATVVGSFSYQPPIDTSVDFQFDVTKAVQALLDGGATFIGLKIDCTSDPNAPNILSDETTLRIKIAANGCPWDCQDSPDGVVGIVDLLALLAAWGGAGLCDFDGNNVVAIEDLLQLLAHWGPC